MLAEDTAVDPDHIEQGSAITPEARMWMACLIYLVDDAQKGWLSDFEASTPSPETAWAAWADLIDAGPQLRQVCNYTGHEPEFISEKFVQWCNANPPGSVVPRRNGRRG